jgi:hypothetical protein
MIAPLNVPIGYFIITGNLCPQDGIYRAANDNSRSICNKGEVMPEIAGQETGWTLESYWMRLGR